MKIIPVNNNKNNIPSFKATIKFSDEVIHGLQKHYNKNKSKEELRAISEIYVGLLISSFQQAFEKITRGLDGEFKVSKCIKNWPKSNSKESKIPNLQVTFKMNDAVFSINLDDRIPVNVMFRPDHNEAIQKILLITKKTLNKWKNDFKEPLGNLEAILKQMNL